MKFKKKAVLRFGSPSEFTGRIYREDQTTYPSSGCIRLGGWDEHRETVGTFQNMQVVGDDLVCDIELFYPLAVMMIEEQGAESFYFAAAGMGQVLATGECYDVTIDGLYMIQKPEPLDRRVTEQKPVDATVRTKGKLVIFTGAGISADSGLATFRDVGGTWDNYDLDVVCNGRTWRKNREAVVSFYNARRIQAAEAIPNSCHFMIAEWQRLYGAFVITQNVDDLLERAGATQVLHVHGALSDMRCVACGHSWSVGAHAWGVDARCRCGSVKGVRPDIVLFNEPAPNYQIMHEVFANLTEHDVLLVMGTSGQVVDISAIAFWKSATTILSNLESAKDDAGVRDDDFNHVIHGRAVDTIDPLDTLLKTLLIPLEGANEYV